MRAYMAHHQGMSLVAFADVVNAGVMRSRFHAEPIVQATELLLAGAHAARRAGGAAARRRSFRQRASARTRASGGAPLQFSARRHSAHATAFQWPLRRDADLGGLRLQPLARYRHHALARRSHARLLGQIHLSARRADRQCVVGGLSAERRRADSYEAVFFEDHAEIIRRDRSLTTTLEVVVSSEDDAEVRRVSITNLGVRARDIQVTSYAELSLTTQAADAAHPAFSNLFVETEFVPDVGALLATRRKRSDDETSVWAAHVLVVDGETVGDLQYETDRARFVGRARNLRNPVSIMDGRPLSNTVGSVLDPIISLRRTVRIPPGSTAHLIFSTIVAATREEVLDLADKYRDPRTFERTLTLAWTQAQVQLHHLGISSEEAHLFQRLANAVLYFDSSLRPASDVLARTPLDISTLWAQGISGDLPIVLARIDDADDVEMIRQLLRAHEYWRMKQLSADVVIINEKATSYVQELHDSLEALVRGSQLRLSPDPRA